MALGGYNGNPNLPKGNSKYQITPQMLDEMRKCIEDPIYFAETYFKIVHVDDGLIPFKLYEYQKEAIRLADDNRKFVMNASRQCGKCISINTLVKLRNRKSGEVKEITIGDFMKLRLKEVYGRTYEGTEEELIAAYISTFARATINNDKFIASTSLDDWDIESDCGWVPATHLHITKEFEVYEIILDNGFSLECADDHIVFMEDMTERFVKDVALGEYIQTVSGPMKVCNVTKLNRSEHMFDFTVDHPDHRYYTNGILSHNTSVATVIILHYALFNKNKKIGLLANKADTAQEILSRIQLAYEYLPHWLKCGVVEWNKRRVEFDNGTIIMAAASSASSVRGQSLSMLYLDEIAFVENFEEFSASVMPTLSSGKHTRMIFTSTPNGLNHFYEYVEGAKKGTNGFSYLEVPWYEVPGRDEAWKEETLGTINHDLEKFKCEYECNFVGSSGTLISGAALKSLSAIQPTHHNPGYGYKVYDEPVKEKQYVCIVDVSRGKGLDYSAFHIIDVSQIPYRQVATFRNNMITPIDYAEFIFRSAKAYNEAHVLVEVNDIGGQISDLLYFDYGYENIIHTENHGRSGKRVSGGFGKNIDRGIRTTKTVKAIGCSMLKLLIEQRKLELVDRDSINELNTFSKKGNSYEAESGHNDDLVMGLVLFGWLTQDPFFKEMNNDDVMHHLRERTEDEIMEELVSFGFRYDASDDWDDSAPVKLEDGNWWSKAGM